jgi:hypothetical protein
MLALHEQGVNLDGLAAVLEARGVIPGMLANAAMFYGQG